MNAYYYKSETDSFIISIFQRRKWTLGRLRSKFPLPVSREPGCTRFEGCQRFYWHRRKTTQPFHLSWAMASMKILEFMSWTHFTSRLKILKNPQVFKFLLLLSTFIGKAMGGFYFSTKIILLKSGFQHVCWLWDVSKQRFLSRGVILLKLHQVFWGK